MLSTPVYLSWKSKRWGCLSPTVTLSQLVKYCFNCFCDRCYVTHSSLHVKSRKKQKQTASWFSVGKTPRATEDRCRQGRESILQINTLIKKTTTAKNREAGSKISLHLPHQLAKGFAGLGGCYSNRFFFPPEGRESIWHLFAKTAAGLGRLHRHFASCFLLV